MEPCGRSVHRLRGWNQDFIDAEAGSPACSGRRKQCLNITVQIDTRLLFQGFVVMEIRFGPKTNLQSLLINKDLRNFIFRGSSTSFQKGQDNLPVQTAE